MSFFGQSQRKSNFEKTQIVPSPFQYNPKVASSSNRAKVPFGSTTKLTRSNVKPKESTQQPQLFSDETIMFDDINAKIKIQDQMSSMFKSESQRFIINHVVQGPGPGQYNLRKNKQQNRSLHHFPLHQSHVGLQMKKTNHPSIPNDNLGYKEAEDRQMKKVKPINKGYPHPGTYDLRTSLDLKTGKAWKPEKIKNKQIQQAPGPGNYELNSSLNAGKVSCFLSSANRFGEVQKIKPERRPGPGEYNPPLKSKVSHNAIKEGHFNSKTSRFDLARGQYRNGPGTYFNEKSKSKSVVGFKKINPNLSSTEKVIPTKKSIFDINNINPGPGTYKTTTGLSHQIKLNLLRKHSQTVLPLQKRKFFKINQQEEMQKPGPGAYEPTKQPNPVKGKISKKTQVINLKQQQMPGPSPADYKTNFHTIQGKIKQMNSKLTLTEQKPFHSGVERFNHYSNQSKQLQHNTVNNQEQQVEMIDTQQFKKVKRLVQTTIKVRVPFGISSSKYDAKIQSNEGSDYYDSKMNWIKPSFNLRSRLQ